MRVKARLGLPLRISNHHGPRRIQLQSRTSQQFRLATYRHPTATSVSTMPGTGTNVLHTHLVCLFNVESHLSHPQRTQLVNTLIFLIRNKYTPIIPLSHDFNVILVKDDFDMWRMDVTLREQVVMFGAPVETRKGAMSGLRARIEKRAAQVVREEW